MSKKQLITVYAFILFVMVWGLDLLNAIKFRQPITLGEVLHGFAATQLVYAGITMLATHRICLQFFVSKKWALWAFAMLALIPFFILLRYGLEEWLAPAFFNFRNYAEKTTLTYYALDNVYYALIYITLGFLVFLFDNQLRAQKVQAELLQKTKEAELQFLRSQINPHFLFNTLNNIYTLVYEQSPKAPQAVLKLSDLMRYLLYEQQTMVPLSKEWDYLKVYIELQQLRFPFALPLQIAAPEDLHRHLIPPHLLICFLENAFKHGEFKNPQQPLVIELVPEKTALRFLLRNKIGRQQKDQQGGVGLANIRRRLQLVYGQDYQLNVQEEKGWYTATLQLPVKKAAHALSYS